MWTDTDHCYKALVARDSRFDGQFYVAVLSTGIYCRPVCPARTPKRENCRFFPSAAAAEVAGYRPCLRCRPELAPGHASVDANQRLARSAASQIEDGALSEAGMDQLARRLGVSERHLRRVFLSEFGVSPIEYAQTQRLLLAKRLLTDTSMPVTEVALAAGFGSVRRFHALFQQRYRLRPVELRKCTVSESTTELVFELAYRPPYAWAAQRDFLADRVIDGVEAVVGDRYLRTVLLERDGNVHKGWITVEPSAQRATLRIVLSGSLAMVVPEVLGRIKRQFDLACQPQDVVESLGALAESMPGLRVPGAFDGFEMAVRAVLGQQITVRAARTLAGRLAKSLGESIAAPSQQLHYCFPSASKINIVDGSVLGELGIIRNRIKAIKALAQACISGELVLHPGTDVEKTLRTLKSLPGIGEWTAQYIAMRALAWPDAFPHSDYGILKAMGEDSPRQALMFAEQWRPWRAYAAAYLWYSLGAQEQRND